VLDTSPVASNVALGRRLRQRILGLRELQAGFGAANRRLRFVQSKSGVDSLEPYEHGTGFDELTDVDRRRDHSTRRVRRDIRRFIRLEASRGLNGDGLILGLDGCHGYAHRGRRLRCGLGGRAAPASRRRSGQRQHDKRHDVGR
jgi:hypothetical protein